MTGHTMRNWTALVIVMVCCLASRTNGSAIPMWEFLAREEKTSHLYAIFTRQVATYCSETSSPDCNKNLLVVGLQNLANLDEIELDRLDPYQRDASDLIWHAMIGTYRLPAKYHDSYDEADPLATTDQNGLESMPVNDYVRPDEHTGPYLVGPMVIRVFPDGRPVPEDSTRPLPRDEDLEVYSKIPSISDIEASLYKKIYQPTRKAEEKRTISRFHRDHPLFRFDRRAINPRFH